MNKIKYGIMKVRSIYSKFKNQAEKIIWITLFWIIIEVFQFLNGYSILIQLKFDITDLSPITLLMGNIITGLSSGLIGGSLIVFFWENWLRTKSYGWSLLNILWSYTLVYIVVATISGLFFYSSQLNVPFLHMEAWQATWIQITSLTQIQIYLFWLLIVTLTLIALLVNDKYGPGIFVSFLLGKYFHPQREERIFMFLDLRGSTTIAEKLGEGRYFNFLKDVFRDATPGILNSKGEIYQYVGDEIVISWKKDNGTKRANCLQCFFDIQQLFLNKAAYYRETYEGIVPEFKAGLHYGFVMVGEIGIVKRDIAYSGDVLNTTARIQSKCNELGVNILISKYLLDKLESMSDHLKPSSIGEIELRGKRQSMMLFTV
jgi:adenylate cyclase